MTTNLRRSASAVWKGSGLEGSGIVNTRSGALNELPYSHRSRFKNEEGRDGSNPEEMIAAAHAACFNMALSFQLNGKGYTANSLNTEAKVILGQEGYDYHIERIDLILEGDVPNISDAEFQELATVAKENCPISQALSAVEISLSATLK